MSAPRIVILGLPHDKKLLLDPGAPARIRERSLDDECAGEPHQHLRLDFAVNVRMIPIQPFWHIRGHMEMVGEAALSAARRTVRRVRAGEQHLVLRRYRRHGKAM